MRRKSDIFIKVLIFILLLAFIYGSSYLISFIRYDDKEIIETKVLIIQNQILKKELEDIKNMKSDLNYEMGKVIIRDIHSFYNEVVINVDEDKVDVGNAVINDKGLVGVIYKKEKDLSYVKLLSSEYNVSVRIGDTYGNLSKGNITLLDKYSDIKEGDLVYTSGLNEIPKDIYVGKIVSVSMDNENLGKEVKVELVNNKYLNYVGVINS